MLSRSLRLVWLLCLLHLSAGATDFFVTTVDDSGPGSLRQAILDANAVGGGTITFSNTTGTITLSSPLPQITANSAIEGPGTNVLTVSGSNSFRVFAFSRGTTNTLSGLTI